jgi:hypothetical protein
VVLDITSVRYMRSGYQNTPSSDVVRYYMDKAVEIVGEESPVQV